MGVARFDPDRGGYRIYVGNLANSTTHDDMAKLFSPFGPVLDIWLARYSRSSSLCLSITEGDHSTAITSTSVFAAHAAAVY